MCDHFVLEIGEVSQGSLCKRQDFSLSELQCYLLDKPHVFSQGFPNWKFLSKLFFLFKNAMFSIRKMEYFVVTLILKHTGVTRSWKDDFFYFRICLYDRQYINIRQIMAFVYRISAQWEVEDSVLPYVDLGMVSHRILSHQLTIWRYVLPTWSFRYSLVWLHQMIITWHVSICLCSIAG